MADVSVGSFSAIDEQFCGPQSHNRRALQKEKERSVEEGKRRGRRGGAPARCEERARVSPWNRQRDRNDDYRCGAAGDYAIWRGAARPDAVLRRFDDGCGIDSRRGDVAAWRDRHVVFAPLDAPADCAFDGGIGRDEPYIDLWPAPDRRDRRCDPATERTALLALAIDDFPRRTAVAAPITRDRGDSDRDWIGIRSGPCIYAAVRRGFALSYAAVLADLACDLARRDAETFRDLRHRSPHDFRLCIVGRDLSRRRFRRHHGPGRSANARHNSRDRRLRLCAWILDVVRRDQPALARLDNCPHDSRRADALIHVRKRFPGRACKRA